MIASREKEHDIYCKYGTVLHADLSWFRPHIWNTNEL